MSRTWVNNGDHLKLEGYTIRIRRIAGSEMASWHDALFHIEVDGLPTQRRMTLEMAKECGEEAAAEIDELPIVMSPPNDIPSRERLTMPNENIKAILGQPELHEIAQEIEHLQGLAMSLQAVGLQTASDKVMNACRKISNVLDDSSWDVQSSGFPDPSI